MTGDLWIGDVGQNAFEEIDFQAAASAGGENYAWNRREGFSSFNGGVSLPGDVEPVYDYAHGSGPFEGNSLIGGYVYRGQINAFAGLYIFADSRSSNVWSFDPADPINSVQRINDLLVPDAGAIGGGPIPDDIVSFAEDGSGNLYMVEIDGEIHKISINLPGTHTVLVVAGEVANDIDFGNQDPQLSSISDFVWHDLDADGIQDSGELGIDNVTVNLLNGDTLGQITSTTTNSSGQYSFGNLAAGNYVVEFVAPPWLLVQPSRYKVADSVDSDADPVSGQSSVITLAASTNIDTVDAGLYQLATIGDRVWDDVDGNGIQNTGENGLNGVDVDLIGQFDDFQDGTTQGWIQHTNPTFTQPFNVPNGGPDGGPDGADDAFMRFNSSGSSGEGSRLVARNLSQWTGDLSNTKIEADVKNFGSTVLTLRIAIGGPGGWFATNNQSATTFAAGADWSRVVFSVDPSDLAAVNGATDIDATLAAVTELRILSSVQPDFRGDVIAAALGVDNITAVIDQTTTGGDGNYGFSVEPGNYQVRFNAPEGSLLSPQNAGGGDISLDSDPDPISGVTSAIVVFSGQNEDTIDAGLIALTLSINDVTVNEATATADFTVTLSAASEQNVSVTAATSNGTATAGLDYTAVAATVLNIAAGATTASFSVPILPDTLDELDETFFVNLTSAVNASIADAQGSGTITDDDPTPTLSINDVTVNEATATADFTVTLSAASGQDVSVTAATANDTATAGADYTAVAATVLNIAAGATTASFSVPILQDTLDELDETFFVNLTSAVNASIADAQGVGTIVDDEGAVTLSINDLSVDESAGTANFTVTLSAASGQDVSVTAATANDTATAGSDYTAVAATVLNISAGATTASFSVPILQDTLDELDETFFVNLTSAVNASIADAQGIGTITDDDPTPTLSINDVTVNEATATANFTVTLSAASGQDVSVTAATANDTATAGADYTAAAATVLNIAAGATTASFSVPILQDTLDELDETFFVNLTSAVNASIADAQGSGTITDDDPTPTLSINDVTVNEATATANFTVTLSAASGQDVSVTAATANDTATAGADYTAAAATVLNISAGATTASFSVPILQDTLDELDETFFVNLTSAVNASIADAQGSGTITDDDPTPTLSINDVTVNEATATANFTVTLSAASGQDVSVTAATANDTATAGADYTAAAATVLNISAGATTASFSVPILQDTLDELDETFFVNLTSAVNASIADAQGSGTITDDDPTPTLSINDVTVNEATATANFTVTLSAASGQDVSVIAATANDTATAGADYTAAAATVLNISAGATTASFSVPILQDTLDELDETFFVNLTSAVNASIADAQGVGTITDDDPTPTLSINDVTVNEATATANFTVTLSAASGQDVSVIAATANDTATAGADYTAAAATVLNISAGATTASFSVPILQDTLDELDETFFVNLTSAVNASIADAQGSGTITDDDPTPTLSINDVTVNEATATANFTVTLSAASGQDVSVTAATANDTATAGADYAAVSATVLNISAGATTASFSVPILQDTLDELDETFFVNLTAVVNASIADAQGVGTITDDDPTPTLSINDVTVQRGNGHRKLHHHPFRGQRPRCQCDRGDRQRYRHRGCRLHRRGRHGAEHRCRCDHRELLGADSAGHAG